MEMNTLAGKQRGISLAGFVLIAIGVIFVAILGMKMVPAYVHSAQIAQIFKTIASDPAMRNATIKEIKDSYSKRADINYITDITAEDIDVFKGDGEISISANYSVKIPLVGNITLVLDFNPSSS
jgi:Tfp pilus assembly protein PilV